MQIFFRNAAQLLSLAEPSKTEKRDHRCASEKQRLLSSPSDVGVAAHAVSSPPLLAGRGCELLSKCCLSPQILGRTLPDNRGFILPSLERSVLTTKGSEAEASEMDGLGN